MVINRILIIVSFTIQVILLVIGLNIINARIDDIQEEIAFFSYSDLTIQVNNVSWEDAESAANKDRDK